MYTTKRVKRFVILIIVTLMIVFLANSRTRFKEKHIGHDKHQPKRATDADDSLIVVLTFPLLNHQTDQPQRDYQELSFKDRDQRMEEYISSLQSTLLHKHVTQVHVLYDNDMLPGFIKTKVFANDCKLHFYRIENSRKASQIFEYVFNFLENRLVMVMQADTYPGQGFELISKRRNVEHHLLYALTRHGHMEDSCDLYGEFCDQKNFVGSHDAYVFVPRGKLPHNASSYLDNTTTSWGIDLLIVWVFENVLHYNVLNPCKVIFIYHRHCSFIRNGYRTRVNTDNTTGWSPPTERLI